MISRMNFIHHPKWYQSHAGNKTVPYIPQSFPISLTGEQKTPSPELIIVAKIKNKDMSLSFSSENEERKRIRK